MIHDSLGAVSGTFLLLSIVKKCWFLVPHVSTCSTDSTWLFATVYNNPAISAST